MMFYQRTTSYEGIHVYGCVKVKSHLYFGAKTLELTIGRLKAWD